MASNATTSPSPSWIPTYMKIADFYIMPFIYAFGAVGNVLSFCVFRKQKYITTSSTVMSTTAQCMRFLAVTDFLCIIGLISASYLRYIPFSSSYIAFLVVFCKIQRPFTHTSMCTSHHLLIAMAANRFIAVKWPLRAKSICTIKRVRLAFIILLIFNLIIIGLPNAILRTLNTVSYTHLTLPTKA